jgi:2-oxoglutarate ferredoxin oxidoreductase subunit gamma
MQTEIIIAGFGGQGVLFAGQLLAYAAMDAGKEVTWIPSYGPEMRGGTANCTVIIADEEIGAPTVRNPKAAMVLNLPSFDKYEPLVTTGGVLIVNQSLVDRGLRRTDLNGVLIPANEIAERLGDKRLTNMVMLGALLSRNPVLSLEAIEQALAAHLPERHRNLLLLNYSALREGTDYAQKVASAVA